MNATQALADRDAEPTTRVPERAPLLGLVRKLIAYGRGVIASLQSGNPTTPPADIAHRHGSLNLALIIARITRGLMMAAVLEKRLLRSRLPVQEPAERAAAETPPEKPPVKPRAKPGPRRPAIDDEAELRGVLPSAREIALRLRNRRTGAVLIDICRDLGIDGSHPLWREICSAIIVTRGNMMTLLRTITGRYFDACALPLPPLEWPAPHEASPAVPLHPP